eukprot:TRINITY_DN9633_c0_g1_i1.p1 TRINITY_DN9633_c0_g1~~TRINITY_DN9633_c0_g1_i1.p1  ORF type:complete len:1225 (+),score=315.75 TRINITY_DN9633_c0_g1_i1:84-3677(+)
MAATGPERAAERARIEAKVFQLDTAVQQLTAGGGHSEEEAVAALEHLVHKRSALLAKHPEPDSGQGCEAAVLLVGDLEKLVGRYNRLAVAALHQGDLPRAFAWLQRAEATVAPQGGPFPGHPAAVESRLQLQATTLNNLACLARRRGKLPDAVRHLQSACSLEVQASGAPRASTLVNLAVCLTGDGQPERAQEECVRAINALSDKLDAGMASAQERQLLPVAWHNLGLAQLAVHDTQRATDSLEKAVQIARDFLGAQHPTTLQAEVSLGKATMDAKLPSRRGQRRRSSLQPEPPAPEAQPQRRPRRRSHRRASRSATRGARAALQPTPPSSAPASSGGGAVRLPMLRPGSSSAAAADLRERPPVSDGEPMTKAVARARHRRRQSELRERMDRRRLQQQQKQGMLDSKKDGSARKRHARDAAHAAAAAEAAPAAPSPSSEPRRATVAWEPPGSAKASEARREGSAEALLRQTPPLPATAVEENSEAAGENRRSSAGPSPDPAAYSTPLIARRVEISPLTFSDIKGEVREASVRAGQVSRTSSRPPSTEAGTAAKTETKRRFESRRAQREQILAAQRREEDARRDELFAERRREAEKFAALQRHQRSLQERRVRAARAIQKNWAIHMEKRLKARRERMAHANKYVEDESAVNRYACRWLKKTEGGRALARRLEAGKQPGLPLASMVANAAVTIQRGWALKAARLERARRLQQRKSLWAARMDHERLRRAATTVQQLYRGHRGRMRALWTQFESRRIAARVLWRWWIRRRRRKEQERAKAAELAWVSAACLRIQRRWRGFCGRLEAAERRLRSRIALIRSQECHAAVAIQRIHRGRSARTRAAALSAQRESERQQRRCQAQLEQEQRDAAEAAELRAETERVLARADEARRSRLAEADRHREEARQLWLEKVVAAEAERELEKFRAQPPLRHLQAARMAEREKLDALTAFAKVHLAAVRLQRALRRFVDELTPARRARCAELRRRARDLREQSRAAVLAARNTNVSARAAAEARKVRQAHEAEIDALMRAGAPPAGPAPPPRAAEVRRRREQEEAAHERWLRGHTEQQRDAIRARLRSELQGALVRGDARTVCLTEAGLTAGAEEALSDSEMEARAAARKAAGEAAERRTAAIQMQRVTRGSASRSRTGVVANRSREDRRGAREWQAARTIQGLWFMFQARELLRVKQAALNRALATAVQ